MDAFQYGVSINRIAYQVGGEGNLYIMPSGTDPDVDEEIIRNDRWRRLSGGFREVGALLLLVARADAPGLDELVGRTDGLILAGEPRAPAGAPVIATGSPPRARARSSRPSRQIAARRTARRLSRHMGEGPERSSAWIIGLAAIVVLVLGAAMWWWSTRGPGAARTADTTGAADTSALDTAGLSLSSLPFGDDPADSVRAAAYAVELAKLNTLSGAILKLDAETTRLPAVTYAPTRLGPDGDRWYVILAGAYQARGEADSLLSLMRDQAIVDMGVGTVIRLPYALLLEEQVTRATAPAVVRAYRDRELPAYALLMDDGRARIYAGAFESPGAAADLASSAEAAGLRPVVVYRIGRPF